MAHYVYYNLNKTIILLQNCFLSHLTSQHKIHEHKTEVITIENKKQIKMPQLCSKMCPLSIAILETWFSLICFKRLLKNNFLLIHSGINEKSFISKMQKLNTSLMGCSILSVHPLNAGLYTNILFCQKNLCTDMACPCF